MAYNTITINETSVKILEEYMEIGESYETALRKLLNLPYKKKKYEPMKKILISSEVYNILNKIKGKRTYSEVIQILRDIKENNFDDELFNVFLKYTLSDEERNIYENLRLHARR